MGQHRPNMQQIINKIKTCFKRGGTVFIAGNGGSSAHASHLSEELISLCYPAIALNDPQVLTALTNDFSSEEAFAIYLEAVAKEGDLFIAISTSYKSENILEAIDRAKEIDIEYIKFPRRGKTTEDIQDYQQRVIHKIYKAFK